AKRLFLVPSSDHRAPLRRACAPVGERLSASPYTPCDSPAGEKNPVPTPTNTMSFTTAGPDEIWPPRSSFLSSAPVAASKARSCAELPPTKTTPPAIPAGPKLNTLHSVGGHCHAMAPFVSSSAKAYGGPVKVPA